MVDEVTIRQAIVADIPDLAQLRRTMFEAMGFDDPAQLCGTARNRGGATTV